MHFLVKLARRHLGDIILYTTDGSSKPNLENGTVLKDNVYSGGSSYCVYCHHVVLEERDEPLCSRRVSARRSHLCHCH
ncbi:hypothetical protein Dimus_029327 [Dionaea muscipula]